MNETVRAWLPAVLIGLGIVSLLDRLGWAGGRGGWLWGLVLLIAGAAFIAAHLRGPRLWWAIFPGIGFIAVAAATFAGSWVGAVLLALGGAAMLALYLRSGGAWWSLVGAGALLSLALLATIERIAPRFDTLWLLFAGVGVTLAVVYFRREQQAPGWSLPGSAGFLGMGLVSLLVGQAVGIFIAIFLMAAGGFLVWRQQTLAPAPTAIQPPPTAVPPAQSSESTPPRRRG